MTAEIRAGDWVQRRTTREVGKVDEILEGLLWFGDDPSTGTRWPVPVVRMLGRRTRSMVPMRELVKLR